MALILTAGAGSICTQAGRATFNPYSLGSVAFDIDFTETLPGSVITRASGKVASITDCSGNGQTFAQVTVGKQPAITANASANKNSTKSTLQAATLTRGAACNVNATLLTLITSFSLFMVIEPAYAGGGHLNDGIFCSQSPGSGGDAGATSIETSNSGSAYQWDAYGAGTGFNTGYGATGIGSLETNSIQVVQLNYDATTGAGTWRTSSGYFGNFPVVSTFTKLGLQFPTGNVVTIGNNASNTQSANVYRMLMYRKSLTAGESALVFSSLADFAGIQNGESTWSPPLTVARYDFSGLLSTVTVSGGKITTCTDASGNGYTTSQATALRRPTQNVAFSPTGLNTATFAHNAGNPICLISTDLNLADDVRDSTTYIWLWPSTVSANDQYWGSNSNRDNCWGFETDSTGSGNSNKVEVYFNAMGSYTLSGNNTFNAGTGYCLIHKYVSAKASNSYVATLTSYICSGNTGIAGAVVNTSSQKYGYYSARAGYATNNSLVIGGDPASNGNLTLQGDIGEIILRGAADSAATIEAIRAAGYTKWGWG